ncbi:MAG: glutamate-cysteine ligase family protein [Candidatus Omnitrophota bacterium]|nr:glutamate-cysteine ligase family protein [Candidatus Omnitrophota bacterium]
MAQERQANPLNEVVDEPLHLFEGYGIELEYMAVSEDTLCVAPIVDEILKKAHGSYTIDHISGEMGWANELVCHVIEIRTDDPADSLQGLAAKFSESVAAANALADSFGCRLMPTAMHPWMEPERETKLWPHEYNEVYRQFDKIFNCKRHGWANLQSCQINLPFSGDAEFGKLHAAIRLLLPLMPALATSSPFMANQLHGRLNNRLAEYRVNSARVPSIVGSCIPEAVFTKKEYETAILNKIYNDIRPMDAEGILQHEWLNARGAIARFDRDAIEIRVLDMQECPAVDIAICKAIVSVLKALVDEKFISYKDQASRETEPLEAVLKSTIQSAELTAVTDTKYLEIFGLTQAAYTAREIWHHLLEKTFSAETEEDKHDLEIVKTILDEGVLARRIINAVGRNDFSRENLRKIYGELCDCLNHGEMFRVRQV